MHTRQGILVTASARLHLGFFDLNGETGRRFGSMGLSLEAPVTQIELSLAQRRLPETTTAPRAKTDYVQHNVTQLLSHANVKQAVNVKVHTQIPRHSGLGSGTQMALAIGTGLNHLLNLNLSLQQIAAVTARGLRSGIGIGTFASGGLVLDGGRGPNTLVPPIIAQFDFPADWRILLIFDRKRTGTHGAAEQQAFAQLKNAQAAATAQNCHHILMQALPAIQERDFHAFSKALAQLQLYTGSYFSSAQGGLYASPAVAEALEWLIAQGHAGVGQTSWGPTGFAIFENTEIAEQMQQRLQHAFAASGLEFQLCRPKNTGASVNDLRNTVTTHS